MVQRRFARREPGFNCTYESGRKNRIEPIEFKDFALRRKEKVWEGEITIAYKGEDKVLPGSGNGQLDAVSNAIRKAFNISVKSLVYSEHDLDRDSDSRGIAYFGLTGDSGNVSWGAGIDTDIITASIKTYITAINRMSTRDNRL